jgi:hypothetical protein
VRAALLIFALAACKQAKEPAEPSAVLAKSRELSAQACACKDRACAAALKPKWNELTQLLHGGTFTDEQVEGLTVEDERFQKCLAALDH